MEDYRERLAIAWRWTIDAAIWIVLAGAAIGWGRLIWDGLDWLFGR